MHSSKAVSVLLLFALAELGTADLTVQPQNFTVQFDQNGHPSNNLTVICTPPAGEDIRGISFLQLRKQRDGEETDTKLATLMPHANTGHLIREVGLTDRKYNISWLLSADDPTRSLLHVDFHDASCLDAGQFKCRVHLYREGSQETEVMSYSTSVTTRTLPEQVLLMQRPAYDSFIVNQTIEIQCSGQVGWPPAYYRWQYRHTGHGTEEESDFEAVTFGVTQSKGPYPQGFCKYHRSTTLWLRAKEELNGMELRCLLVRDVTRYENLSASFTLKVKDGGCIPECWNGGVCENYTCQCPPEFSGSACEHPVDTPCTANCDGTSASPTVHIASVCPVTLLLLCHAVLLTLISLLDVG